MKYLTLLYRVETESVRGGILRLRGKHNKALAIECFLLFPGGTPEFHSASNAA